jgi:hypothetical protein
MRKHHGVVLLLGVSLVLIFSFFILNKKKPSISPQLSFSPTPSVAQEKGGWMKLKVKERNATTVFQPIVLTLFADSGNNVVAGFDLVLSYSPQKVAFKQVDNLSENFEISTTNEKDRLIITGYLKPGQEKKEVFNSAPLLNITFEAQTPGRAEFKIIWEKSQKNESNLINDKTEDILNAVEGTYVDIGNKIVLTKNAPVVLKGGIELTLAELESKKQDCIDCLSYAKVIVSKDKQKKEFVFKVGGISGLIIDHFSQFNYNFYLNSINDDEITLIYSPQ